MIPKKFEGCGDIIARCPNCQSVIFVCINHPSVVDADTKRELGDMAAKGYLISAMSHDQFKKEEKFGHAKDCVRLKISTPANDQQLQLMQD